MTWRNNTKVVKLALAHFKHKKDARLFQFLKNKEWRKHALNTKEWATLGLTAFICHFLMVFFSFLSVYQPFLHHPYLYHKLTGKKILRNPCLTTNYNLVDFMPKSLKLSTEVRNLRESLFASQLLCHDYMQKYFARLHATKKCHWKD